MFALFYSYSALQLLALLCMPSFINAITITTAPQPPSSSLLATCEFRTINYITDILPQLCGKSSWSGKNATTSTKSAVENSVPAGEGQVTPTPTETSFSQQSHASDDTISSTPTSTGSAEATAVDLDGGELNAASFLSFEEWKEQTLKKAGQNNPNIGKKRSREKKRNSESITNNLDSLGDEGEIDLDFGAFKGSASGEAAPKTTEGNKDGTQSNTQNLEKVVKRKDQYRSKDAGKTCKERFSYASFDAGATVLKTHRGAKNSKAVLIENKDSYMLSECSTPNKFLIIELSVRPMSLIDLKTKLMTCRKRS